MKARRVINDLVRFDFQLRGLWLLVLCFGLALVVFGFWLEDKDNATVHDLLPKLVAAIGAAASGFASSAFFSRPDQFLLRGAGDAVYLIENCLLKPRAYHLADRETMNALGGKWHEISHVSERKKNCICKCFGKGKLSLKQATLYHPEGANSVFAVLNETRYGIPDQETLKRIWDSTTVSREEVERYLPGRDLFSVQFWPPQDR